jgi:UV excision repair protein RAD23
MKITIKTLQQKVFQVNQPVRVCLYGSDADHLSQIDAETSETVGDLKKKIQEKQGHVVEDQKLIYSGKLEVSTGWHSVKWLIVATL